MQATKDTGALDNVRKSYKLDKPNVPWSDEEIMDLIPSRDIADPIVETYLATIEHTFRILHVPSFREEYNLYWKYPEQRSIGLTVIILLVIAAASSSITFSRPYLIGRSSTSRETAKVITVAAENWLQRHSQKHLTLTYFQVWCLLVIVQDINAVKTKRSFTTAGALVKFCVSSGFHRDPGDPSLRGKISIFDQEMRRRLWVTILELEQGACIDRGLPSTDTRSLYCDCAPPSNIDDEAFHEGCKELPKPKPIDSFTRSSYLNLAQASLPLRQKLLALGNDPRTCLSQDEVSFYEGEISRTIAKIPKWTSRGDRLEKPVPYSILPQKVLEMQLRLVLLLLYRPFTYEKIYDPWHGHCRMMCLNAATSLLELHSCLKDKGLVLALLISTHVTQAALSICFDLTMIDPGRGRRGLLPKSRQFHNH